MAREVRLKEEELFNVLKKRPDDKVIYITFFII
jgi:hypothetical protein